MAAAFALLAMAAVATAAAELPAPPRPADPAVELFKYPDNRSLRSAWQAMEGSPAVSLVRSGGVNVMAVPCNFGDSKIARAYYDRQVKLDLSGARGLRMDVYCADPSPVSSFMLYLHTPAGWHAASFTVPDPGRWNTVRVDRSLMQAEGKAGGWRDVDRIRISAWRKEDRNTEFYIASISVLDADAPAAVIRPESAARTRPSEYKPAMGTTRLVGGFLDEAGIPHCVINDTELTASALARKKVVILPNNAEMPDEAARAIASFLKSGGSMISFYVVPAQLSGTVPFRMGRHRRQEYTGQFSSIHAAGGKPAGMPPVIAQASWNIFQARPIPGRSRTAAYWFDERGRKTGEPAIIVSDNFIHMTHVMLSDDPANKRRMLLAMTGHFMPGAWKNAAAAETAQIGVFGGYSTLEQAHRGITELAPGDRAVAALLAESSDLKMRSTRLMNAGKYADSFALAAEARGKTVRAFSMTRSPAAGEFRGAWCHSPLGVPEMTWDRAVANLSTNGFNAVFPNISWGATAYYRSSVLPVAPEVAGEGDQLRECLDACRKHGIECHAWMICWNMGRRAPADFVARMKREGRLQVKSDGTTDDQWLCPTHLDNRALLTRAAVEIAAGYAVQGIHFDYIRFPGANYCFCGGCRKLFEKKHGSPVARWPADVLAGGKLRREWLDFRMEVITTFLAGAGTAARKARPDIRISAAVFPDWENDRDDIGQDWKSWCERRLVNAVCPMTYTPDLKEFAAQTAKQRQWSAGAKLYSGIGASMWPSQDRMIRLTGQVEAARGARADGFMLFNYGYSEAAEIVPLCGLGLTATDKTLQR